MRLRLYLTLLWWAAPPKHDVTVPARAWAELLGLDAPSTAGQRRVRDAMSWLASGQFIVVESKPGFPPTLFPLREDGAGVAYTVPGASAEKQGETFPEEDLYVTLPPAFWTQGWIYVVTPPGVAVLLCLLYWSRSGSQKGVWIAPALAKARFDLSEDTWTRGVRELRDLGLIRVSRKPVSEEFGWKRVRNTYSVDLDQLTKMQAPLARLPSS